MLQLEHVVAPLPEAYVPASHGTQGEDIWAAADAEALPTAHKVQTVEPAVVEKLPALQTVHELAPCEEYLPAAQLEQLTDPAAPW